MPLDPGTRLGPHEILAPLGAGGMGEVYKARDTRLDRIVAIKVLPGHLAGNADARQRLEREARAVSDLNHPHICILHDIGHEKGVDYLVMEYLEGMTLGDRLSQGPIPIAEALRFAAQIAEGLDAAHRKGLVHRDLKPGNVMLTRNGAKLLDFGLARVSLTTPTAGTDLTASPTMTTPLTAQGAIVGTFQYMAPEQLEGKEADPRTDIFSFGATLYEMLTGRRAFSGESQASLIASIIREDQRPLGKVVPEASPALERLVQRCLAKRPEERWQSIGDVALELRWIEQTGGDRLPESTASRGLAASAGMAWGVAVAALLLALFVFIRGTPPVETRGPSARLSIPVPGITDFGIDTGAAAPVVSPDGRSIVFGVIDEKGKKDLWIRRIDDFNARPLANTEGAQLAFWSPDSRHVGFFANGRVRRVEAATGRVQSVADAPYVRGGSWSVHGKILYAPAYNTGIHLVDAAGGEVRQLTMPEPDIADSSHRWPCFLPDGRHYLYVLWTNDTAALQDRGGVFVATIDDSEPPRRVLPDASNVVWVPQGYLLVMRGENLIAVPFDADRREVTGDAVVVAEEVDSTSGTGFAAFSASNDGTLVYATSTGGNDSQLVWYGRSGTRTGAVGEPAPFASARLSPDETRAAVTLLGESSSTGEIWIVDLQRGVRTRLASGTWFNENPVWSDDGTRVIYASQQRGTLDFYSRLVDGSGEEQAVLLSDEDKRLFDASMDGRYLAYGDLSFDVWIHSFGDTKADRILYGEPRYGSVRFSPDTRWITYVSNESGRDEVYVQRFEGLGDGGSRRGGRWQVSTSGGTDPHWRGDGGEIVYLAGTDILAVSLEPAEGGLVLGSPEALFDLPGIPVDMEATADHERFMIVSRGAFQEEQIRVVLNWMGDLGR